MDTKNFYLLRTNLSHLQRIRQTYFRFGYHLMEFEIPLSIAIICMQATFFNAKCMQLILSHTLDIPIPQEHPKDEEYKPYFHFS